LKTKKQKNRSGSNGSYKEEKSDHLELIGIVIESNSGIFKIKLDNESIVTARPTGKIRQNKINIVVGDKVKVALSPYDLTNGMVKTRL